LLADNRRGVGPVEGNFIQVGQEPAPIQGELAGEPDLDGQAQERVGRFEGDSPRGEPQLPELDVGWTEGCGQQAQKVGGSQADLESAVRVGAEGAFEDVVQGAFQVRPPLG